MPGAKAPGAGNRGSGRLAVFEAPSARRASSACASCRWPAPPSTSYMVGSRQRTPASASGDAGRHRRRPRALRTITLNHDAGRRLSLGLPWRSARRGARQRPTAAAVTRRAGCAPWSSASAPMPPSSSAEVPPPAYQLAAQQAACRRRCCSAESGARLRGRLIPWPWTLNVAGRAERYATRAEACAGIRRALARTPVNRTTPASAVNLATTRTATRIPASCSTHTATSPSPRKSCRSSTRRARTGWSPSAATTAPRAGRPPPLPPQRPPAPDPRARAGASLPSARVPCHEPHLVAATAALLATTADAQDRGPVTKNSSPPLIVVEDGAAPRRCRTTGP